MNAWAQTSCSTTQTLPHQHPCAGKLADHREVNIFLRGMVPLVGFKSEVVTYERHERLAGESHYPLSKMLALAFDGITSLSNKPIRLITGSRHPDEPDRLIGAIWAITAAMGSDLAGWVSTILQTGSAVGGVQILVRAGAGSAS